ncbi:GH25 family lysozyme [Vagococcus fluvialis]|uniref:GH25 family lysozyme n=1 Tax=Vagococcus fluvialis TaxID=2738 RepID=UPI00143328DB|nr:GH25 family lysozyme [Vagococcus fluvialis]NKD51086.1 glycosyl hydrolase family 25 [Vagococcus fluvialis]
MKNWNKLILSGLMALILGMTSSNVMAQITNNETIFSVEEQEDVLEDYGENEINDTLVNEEEIEEINEKYTYPSNRSDLSQVEEARSFSARSIESRLSIDEKNRPKSDFIDVSSNNGYVSVEDYKIMKSYGVTGVVVKLTEYTTYRNPYAKSQIENAKAAGLLVSVYHYSWFKNTAQAQAEANYFANMAVELKLSKDTVMVNDIEEPELKYLNGHTENSLAFEKQLNARGFKQVNHYIGLHWINEKRIDPVKLGKNKIWVAAYPYNPIGQEQTEYGAWQWTSIMTFPGVHGNFDMSSDYQGSYSIPPQGKYISDGRYVEISKKGYNTYSDFNWKYRDSSDNLIGNKYQARGRYEHINGSTYYSLYDNQGKWAGYINRSATNELKGPEGKYISDGRYVSISKQNYNFWQNFSWKKKGDTSNVYQKTYLAKGRYEHFNGSTYYSLFDEKGNWQGYLNANGAEIVSNKNGKYISDGRFATIYSNKYNTWQNFNWKFKHSPEIINNRTFLAKGRYENFNGSTYLSLFDDKGEWYGYINSNAVKLSDVPQGVYLSNRGYASIINPNAILYNDFNGTVRKETSKVYHNNYQARGKYHHFNGETYYSLYNDKNVWQGYAKEDTIHLNNTEQGPFIAINEKVTVVKNNYNIWQNFTWKVRDKSSNYYNKQLTAKGKYHHVNGSVYYSLYDGKGNWIGYLNQNAVRK